MFKIMVDSVKDKQESLEYLSFHSDSATQHSTLLLRLIHGYTERERRPQEQEQPECSHLIRLKKRIVYLQQQRIQYLENECSKAIHP